MFVIGLFTLKFKAEVCNFCATSITKLNCKNIVTGQPLVPLVLFQNSYFSCIPLRLHIFNISAVTVRVFWPYWDWVNCMLVITHFVSWLSTASLFFQGHSCLSKLNFCFLCPCLRASFVREQCTLPQLPAFTRLTPRKIMWYTIVPKAIYPKACGE